MAHHWGLIEHVYLICGPKQRGGHAFDYNNKHPKHLLFTKGCAKRPRKMYKEQAPEAGCVNRHV